MTADTSEPSALARKAGWRFETRQADAGVLEVVLAGRWCLDQNPPSPKVLQAELHEGVRRLYFNGTDLGAWDSGFLTFLAGPLKSCAERGIEVDQVVLPQGVQRLLAMASAVPDHRCNPGGATTRSA